MTNAKSVQSRASLLLARSNGLTCALFGLLVIASILLSHPSVTYAACDPTVNPIVCENQLPGNPPSQWAIAGSGDSTIQGFATDISVNKGGTVFFKINTNATAYRITIYRMGYYQGNGARQITSITPSAKLPQTQPVCLAQSNGLVDCGNWAVSASWPVPSTAVSGIYFAKLTRTDTGGSSQIFFVVRDDSSTSPLLFQTSDTTWEAYNQYGGHSLYTNATVDVKVSYNRPFTTATDKPESWVFNAEYPMVRWLEANGYNVSYTTGVDSDRNGGLIKNHQVFLSVGHDEYWSGNQRANVEAARAVGVNLAFFSGNESYWKTRWESSIDGTNTPYRTLVSYKETNANQPIDPQDPPIWTGTWRDPRFSPPADGGKPENELSGNIFMVDGPMYESLQVPYADGQMRFWRNTTVAQQSPGQTYTIGAGCNCIVGYEWDEDVDNGFRPAGLFHLSTSTYSVNSLLQDYGSTYRPGTATHHLTLYRTSSRALVFGAGTVGWAYGLDGNSSVEQSTPDLNIEQATVNLLADMGVQPGTLQAGLVATTASTDIIPPSSAITSPANRATVSTQSTVTITGTATDVDGQVGGVEVSVDGGTSWHPAAGRGTWSYTWAPSTTGTVTILSRATDDSGNIETPGTGITVSVVMGTCPCSIWTSGASPAIADQADNSAVELGVKFRSDTVGYVTGIRFYKGPTNTGTHVGNLWTSSGTLLASATFSNETASGWQQVSFASPVAIAANTTYVVSYHTNVGQYAVTRQYFTNSGVDNPPLHALQSGVDGLNGVYASGASSSFPNNSYLDTNYWVDLVFTTSIPP